MDADIRLDVGLHGCCKLLLTSEELQQVQNIPLLQTEINKPYEMAAAELRSSSHAFVLQHKRHLQQMGTIFCEELVLSEAEQALLLKYITCTTGLNF